MGSLSYAPARGRSLLAPALVLVAVAAVTFLMALDGGAYADTSRDTYAIAIWWILLLAVAAGLWPLERIPRPAIVVGALVAGLALWTLLSTLWAANAEDAYSEFNRVSLYLGVYLLAVFAATRLTLARWIDGLALGIVATAAIAFFSRCFPEVLATEKNLPPLPFSFTRLSYPLEYWNGLAIFVAIAVPLLLRIAIRSNPLASALALFPFPVLGSVVFLTSSRGGVLTAIVGLLALLALVPSVRVLLAAVIGGAGAAAAVGFVSSRSVLVNEPGLAAAGQGHTAFAIVLAVCAGTAVAAYLGFRYLREPIERGTAAMGPVGRRVAVGGVIVAAVAAFIAAHPVRLFDKFKRPPVSVATALANRHNAIQVHLLSGGSSGRWQQWETVLREFKSAPAIGRGAGSYEYWWAQHGTLKGFVKDAHSLYLETLGELGIVGFLLLVGAFGGGIFAGVRRAVAAAGPERSTIAAACAAFVAYAFAAGIDWMWEMTVVSVVGIALLGLMTGSASTVPPRFPRLSRLPLGRRVAARAALGAVAIAAIVALGISLLANRELQASKNAAARGDVALAAKRAASAHRIEPWAASPYVQLALVSEQAGDYRASVGWIEKAIAHDRRDWEPWYLSVRFEIEAGNIRAANAHLARAMKLNPRSPLFASLRSGT